MAIDLNIPDNREKIYINKDLYGEDRVIYFSLSDINIFTRADEARNKISEYIEKRREPINESDAIKLVRDADAFVKEQINHIFDYEVSEAVFGNSSAISQVEGGKMYFEVFLEAVMPHIEKALTDAGNTVQARTAKYTEKYRI